MAAIGIDAINVYPGRASMSARTLFEVRGLDTRRFDNLMMDSKSVNLPCEDPVTNAVNAAKPLIDALGDDERDRIEAVIVGTESGVDFGKALSTYVHDYLGLSRRCRSFEVKHACYGGTAAVQTAAGLIANTPITGMKALVIATDAAAKIDKNTYWEPSQGAGAVAMILGEDPRVLTLDKGASGYHSYEVMDTARPRPDLEAGDSDLSLMSYLHCLKESYAMYADRVRGSDFLTTFDHLAFHMPFGGMVKGAHRTLLRSLYGMRPDEVEADFQRRLAHSLRYGAQIGNVYSAALYVALCSLIDHAPLNGPSRLGLFSYGSGCASEFYSGVTGAEASRIVGAMGIAAAIESRHPLSTEEYELISELSLQRMPGHRHVRFDPDPYDDVYRKCLDGRGLLVLDHVTDFHRVYRWS
ncbi:polyketide biosynthesis 3-hydroxy-3-methylglutaryl-CoA synthase-like enzyme PksG [Micromonospora luteifusca]|uniref:Polyketide biosynthesis 3-hydroxy-3-methylglutaryl-CoA synthase-like enzyme PksG n=1 Tax=Micromonospora luteifusca TaxID=709860 RepID=A0ABS2M1C5_9ACTN|nr:hydroxymethylglutaryl-CoA synthase [Micromonospora luteifusca]MBM7494181.1 polyketide biosynthesis 3-hydroxy-3-methylglutaryl-CoA synthase-like enzyme PksG [Micromonospora luteifusca]